jgi:hypothetical protein
VQFFISANVLNRLFPAGVKPSFFIDGLCFFRLRINKIMKRGYRLPFLLSTKCRTAVLLVKIKFMNSPFSDDSKPYRIKFEQRDQYLYAYVAGEHDSLSISLEFWREIAAECRRAEARKVLIEEDIEESVSMLEMYQIAAEIPQMGFANVLIAFVDRFLEQQSLNEFGELVATNRGLRAKVFNNVKEAEIWLSEN